MARSVPKAGGLLPDGLWNVTTDSPLTGDPHKIEKRLLNLSFGSFLKFKSAFFCIEKGVFFPYTVNGVLIFLRWLENLIFEVCFGFYSSGLLGDAFALTWLYSCSLSVGVAFCNGYWSYFCFVQCK